jgi:hypothetical protein
MAGTALHQRLTWQLAELVKTVAETPRVKTIVFDVPGWPGGLRADVPESPVSASMQARSVATSRRPSAGLSSAARSTH